MSTISRTLTSIFGVIVRGQSYLNILYLLLAFPLGILYFIFLVTGFSLGITLLIIWVGLLILPLVFAGSWVLAMFERQMAILLLNEKIPPMSHPLPADQGAWDHIKAHLTNLVTWKSLIYLFVKFPLGILSFTVVVFFVALAGALVTAPLTFSFFPLQMMFWGDVVWRIDTLGEALIAFVIGLVLALVSLHVMNALAWLSGKFARLMLGDKKLAKVEAQPASVAPAQPEVYIAEREPVEMPASPPAAPVFFAQPEAPQSVVAPQSEDMLQPAVESIPAVEIQHSAEPAPVEPLQPGQAASPEAQPSAGIEEAPQPSL